MIIEFNKTSDIAKLLPAPGWYILLSSSYFLHNAMYQLMRTVYSNEHRGAFEFEIAGSRISLEVMDPDNILAKKPHGWLVSSLDEDAVERAKMTWV